MTVQRHADPATCSANIPAPHTRQQPRGPKQSYAASLDTELTITEADADCFHRLNRASAGTCGRRLYDPPHPSAPALLDRHFRHPT